MEVIQAFVSRRCARMFQRMTSWDLITGAAQFSSLPIASVLVELASLQDVLDPRRALIMRGLDGATFRPSSTDYQGLLTQEKQTPHTRLRRNQRGRKPARLKVGPSYERDMSCKYRSAMMQSYSTGIQTGHCEAKFSISDSPNAPA